MTRIRDLLDRSFSRPIKETITIEDDDPDTVFAELTEYVATDCIKAEYERLFSALAEGPLSSRDSIGVWISGFFGSGKSSFAKNLGYVLANRRVNGAAASCLFLKQVESRRLAECIDYLNRNVPYEVFMFGERKPSAQGNQENLADVMYRSVLRGLDYADDYHIADLERELEENGKLAALEGLCRTEFKEEWRKVRNGSQKIAHASALLHRLDPQTYTSADSWRKLIQVQSAAKLTMSDVVERSFALCGIRRPGRSLAFIADDIDETRGLDERIKELYAIVEQFAEQSLKRQKTGKIPGPVWVIVTSEDQLQRVCRRLPETGVDRPKLEQYFKHQIDLSASGIGEVAVRRVLPKKDSDKRLLKKVFRDHGASLTQNIKLEECSCCTEFDEDQFVQSYPYLPHLIDLSIEILAGLRPPPDARRFLGEGNRTFVKHCFDMLLSDRVQLADQPVGELVSVDKIYELMEGDIPWPKQKDVCHIRERFDPDITYPGMASRVAKVICLLEFVNTHLPRTTKNVAALLVRHVVEAPPIDAVAAILDRLNTARLVRQSEHGWKLYDFDELHAAAAALKSLENALGTVNPRPPGWHNDLIQLGKKLFARLLTWYSRPLHDFNASVRQSLEEIVCVLERRNLADSYAPGLVEHLSLNVAALETRLVQSEKRSATWAASLQDQLDLLHEQVRMLVSLQPSNLEAPDGIKTKWDSSRLSVDASKENGKTTYVIGLFGTGRLYINELLVANIGERAKYLRDTIRLHPGPTPMIYSGHATVKYVSRAQELPAVTSCIRQAVRSGFANLIFLYRHPLDSLLTNWVWWREYILHNRSISGISQIYKDPEDLTADLERNLSEFLAFAEGDPQFFASLPGPRFLSFREFVEETELHLQFATLKLRLEDFMIGPLKQFAKVLELVAPDVSQTDLHVPPPRAKAYGHLAIQERLPGFRKFVDGLDAETKRRISRIGYHEIA